MVDAADVQPPNSARNRSRYRHTHQYLLAAGVRVVALEFDQDLLPGLQNRFEGDANFSLVHGDIRTFNLTELPVGYKVVANIPYYLTSNLVQLLGESSNPPGLCCAINSEGSAERACAQPGNMSILHNNNFIGRPVWGRWVPTALFTPPPKVDSQILILQGRPELLFPDVEPRAFWLVKADLVRSAKHF